MSAIRTLTKCLSFLCDKHKSDRKLSVDAVYYLQVTELLTDMTIFLIDQNNISTPHMNFAAPINFFSSDF